MTGVISEIVDVSPFDPRSLRRRCPARSVDEVYFFVCSVCSWSPASGMACLAQVKFLAGVSLPAAISFSPVSSAAVPVSVKGTYLWADCSFFVLHTSVWLSVVVIGEQEAEAKPEAEEEAEAEAEEAEEAGEAGEAEEEVEEVKEEEEAGDGRKVEDRELLLLYSMFLILFPSIYLSPSRSVSLELADALSIHSYSPLPTAPLLSLLWAVVKGGEGEEEKEKEAIRFQFVIVLGVSAPHL